MVFHNRICKSIRKANSRRLLMSTAGTFSTTPSETKLIPRIKLIESEVFEMQPLEHPISNQELRQKYLMENVQKILNSRPIDRSLRASPSISPPSPAIPVTNGRQYSPSSENANDTIFVETRRKR